MVGKTIDVENILQPDQLGTQIAEHWRRWNNAKQTKIEEWKELRNYLFATDTRTTSNQVLPWANSTTTPKLTQIRDNLHANYFAALFPSYDWMKWEPNDRESNNGLKAKAIKSYLRAKLNKINAEEIFSQLLYDWIDYGNCFARVEHVTDIVDNGDQPVVKYTGPTIHRISPYDICFNPLAPSFRESPKIIKSVMSLGDIKKMVVKDPTSSYMMPALEKAYAARATVSGMDSELSKSDGYVADGFGNIQEYYASGYIEVLTFFGDIYDITTKEFKENRIITIIDRAHVLRDIPNPSWNGSDNIHHAGWRTRPDNLYAMGPLDNLVGMQYRIDHLENMKADVWDQIAYPILKVKGDVEDFVFQPGERIYLGDEGDVAYLSPDVTALNADLQINNLENKMEELAGAPKNAMGIRTPGEKTAFEVNQLLTAANRIFEHKTAHFERSFLEPILNDMLEVGRRNLNVADTIGIFDADMNVTVFQDITKEDITGNGVLRPVGARHFAERARRLQNLQQMWAAKQADPTVAAHLSGKEFARIMADELNEEKLFGVNIAIFEQAETQQAVNNIQVQMEEQEMVSAELGV